MEWRIIEGETKDHWLALEGTDGGYEVEKDGSQRPIYNLHAVAKWDGCVIFSDYANGYGWNHACTGDDCLCARQSIHICDIDDFIATLTALKGAAKTFYADKYNDYWSDH